MGVEKNTITTMENLKMKKDKQFLIDNKHLVTQQELGYFSGLLREDLPAIPKEQSMLLHWSGAKVPCYLWYMMKSFLIYTHLSTTVPG
jgi:hypothetical protein